LLTASSDSLRIAFEHCFVDSYTTSFILYLSTDILCQYEFVLSMPCLLFVIILLRKT